MLQVGGGAQAQLLIVKCLVGPGLLWVWGGLSSLGCLKYFSASSTVPSPRKSLGRVCPNTQRFTHGWGLRTREALAAGNYLPKRDLWLERGTGNWWLSNPTHFSPPSKIRGALSGVCEVDVRDAFTRGLGLTSFHTQGAES